jgi:very-short-patch-repair endonuclease
VLPGSIIDLLEHQYSLVGVHQLRAVCTPAERRRCRRDPHLEPWGPRVLRHRAAAPQLGQQLLAPVLDAGPGAVLWGYAATQWWGFGRFRSFPVDVARHPCAVRREFLGRLHQTTTVDPQLDVTVHRSVPVARPERLILWLAREFTSRFGHDIGAERLERTIDHAWRLRLLSPARIHQLAEERAGQGNAGIVVLRRLLERRPVDYRPTDSNLEARWEQVVGGMASEFRRQVLLGDEHPIGRFDAVHVTRPLVVEIHSEAFHTMPSDIERDAERVERLLAAGFSVVIYWEYDIWHDAATVRSSLREILDHPDERPTLHRPTPAPYAYRPDGSLVRNGPTAVHPAPADAD